MAVAPLNETRIPAILEAGMVPRAASISKYQRYFDGSVYDGKPAFLDETSEVPITDRSPCVHFPGVRNAVNAISSMCLGDKRFPTLTTLTNEDDSVFDDRFGLKKEESKTFDALLGKITEQTRLPAKAIELLEVAMSSGTAVPMAVVIKGRLAVKQLDPKVCFPEYDSDGTTLVAIEERYLYEEKVWSKEQRKFERRVFMYRRRIDTESDVIFEPYEVTNEQDVPACILFPHESPFLTKEKTRFKHDFGFCPVLWYRFLETISEASSIDGRPIHWGLTTLIDAVNYGLSQRYRAGLYCGSPQPYETGVDGDNPVEAPSGSLPGGGASLAGYDSGRYSGTSGIRRKGPGTMWSYPNTDSKVGLLALTGDSLKPLADDVSDNRKTLRESLGHVELDITALSKSELSGRAIEEMKAPQVAVCNKIREDFGANCLLPLVNLLLRVALASSAKGGLYLAGIKAARPILERFYQEVEFDSAPSNDTAPSVDAKQTTKTSKKLWFDPTIKLTWGAYSETTDAEQQMRVTTASTALEKGLVTHESAVNKVKSVFPDISNTDQYMATLQKEIADRKSVDDASLHGHMNALNGDKSSDGSPDGGGEQGGGEGGGSAAGGTGGAPTAGGGATGASAVGTAASALAAKSLSDQVPQNGKAGAKGAPVKAIHDRAISTAGVAETVFKQLAEDFPKDTLGWVRAAAWTGPVDVPLESIDFSNRDAWRASKEPERVQFHVDKISNGDKKPIILVNEPNQSKLIIVDGHHRALAYEQLGLPAYAFIAEVGTVSGEWDVLHSSQRESSKAPAKKDDDKAA
jgi:hypothetical protein